MKSNLMQKSMEILLRGQHESGTYVSSPRFKPYNYCWIRNAAFTAYAADKTGMLNSSRKFFSWIKRQTEENEQEISNIICMVKKGESLLNSEFLPGRYHLDGSRVEDEWPNVGLDSYGILLWVLCEHIRLTGRTDLEKTARSLARYLACLWHQPSYNCWEEECESLHTSTLISISAALDSAAELLGEAEFRTTSETVRRFVEEYCVYDGRLVRSTDSKSIDGSLLWAVNPFKFYEPMHPVMVNTVSEIEKYLVKNGVYRYPEDTYYGGGEWIVLAASLGCYYLESGNRKRAQEILTWIEGCANSDGELPEQILDHSRNAEYTMKWKGLWGEVASPHIWSHASYMVLFNKLHGS